jgi:hypothetical protein
VDGYPPGIRSFGDSNGSCNKDQRYSQNPEVPSAVYRRWLSFRRCSQVIKNLHDLDADTSEASPPEDLKVRHENFALGCYLKNGATGSVVSPLTEPCYPESDFNQTWEARASYACLSRSNQSQT